MKIKDLDGNWIGLAYNGELPYCVDNVSSPLGFDLGFEIVYRLLFYSRENHQLQDHRTIEKFKKVLQKSFGLSMKHYHVEEVENLANSNWWRIYWDKGAFDLRLLQTFERNLAKTAEENNIRVIVTGMHILSRPISYISSVIKKG